ncbi:MAG: sigma-70 family RNA polymerase sigma factor [Terriglobia bacterium]
MAVIAEGFVELSDEKHAGGTGTDWSEEVFQRIFHENYSRVAGVLYRIVGDHSRAEDLAIEAFWRLYRQPQRREGEGNPRGWLYRTATRLGIDNLRATTRRGRYEQQAGKLLNPHSDADPLEDVLRAEKQLQVRRVLAALRPKQAQLLILRASGFSYQELSETLRVKRGAVGTMLIRAENQFRKHYERLYGKQEES